MTKISCLIVDDEPLALDLLEKYIRATPFLELKTRCSSAIEAMGIMNSLKIDLMFLDIQMPELTGIEFSKLIGSEIKVIFTTAFSEYALEGFKVSALDYLLKPFNYEEFLRAAYKAKDWFEIKQTQEDAHLVQDDNYIFVRSEYKTIKINLSEVLYFEGLKDYVKIWIEGNPKPVLTIMSLKSLEELLSPTRFMRIHRSYIIALSKIIMVERSQVIINSKIRITIAEQYKEKFQEFISGRSLT
jgi:two-component system, LytTR family, response regulator LytT